MSQLARLTRSHAEKRGLLWRIPVLSSAIWLIFSRFGSRQRLPGAPQSPAPPQITPTQQALVESARSQPSTGSSPQAAPKMQTRWLGDPRRCATADCLLLLLAVATVVICLLEAHGTARLLLVLAAACLLPGSALLTRLPVEDVLEAMALAVGLGFAIEAVGALAMIWTGWWHPLGWAIVIVTVACGTLLVDLRRSVALTRKPAQP